MIQLDNNLKEQLDYQQGQIINSTEKKVVVSAGPGSGKTYTIVQRISKELSNIEFNQGIIACSFTKEASKQLQEKLEQKCDVSNSFIGTIDSFVLMGIINPYKNRLIKYWQGNNVIKKLKIRMAEIRSIASEITKCGFKYNDKEKYNDYLNEWKQNFLNGIYEISFVNYLVAIYLIRNLPEVKEYLSNKFKSIYIDEAQDLNEFQHKFIKVLTDDCKMNCFLIGDKNQSIYQFRGARPEQFYNLKNIGYVEYQITVSVRCHKSIIEFANAFVNQEYVITGSEESRVFAGIIPTDKNLSDVKGTFMILFETNDLAFKWYEYLKDKNIDVVYSHQIDITSDKEFKDNYFDIIEEILKFYYNFNNENVKLIYKLDEFKLYLSDFVLDKYLIDKELLEVEDNPVDYIVKIFNIFKVDINSQIIYELKLQLENEVYINHYLKRDNINRIMTIHAAKGLEADNVYLRLNNVPYRYDDEYKRKLYVAFSRAKNNLFISYGKNSNIIGSQLDQDIKNLIAKLKKGE